MGFMMFGENDFSHEVQFLADQRLHPDALANPQRNRHQKRAQPARSISQIAVQDAVEFQEGLLVKRDEIEIFGLDATGVEAVSDRIFRKSGVVLLASEPFLLR